jgi:predicted glutamine amidotransferase
MLLLNILIILLLVHSLIYHYLRYKIWYKQDVIACGLFAFIGSSASKFSWDKFNYLGQENDTRGRDSCGVVTAGFHRYGIGVDSDYKDLIMRSEEKPSGKYKVVLGHTRKASIGGVELSFAQPYIFTTKSRMVRRLKKKNTTLQKFVDKNSGKDVVVFSGIHNGTISNYTELAKKYNVNVVGKNDSGTLMEILFKYGHDVLKEYKGTAALIWHNYAENLSYVFKGKSPTFYTTAPASEERPLYAYTESDNNTYFSSLKNPLKFIGGTNDTIDDVVPNVLYKLQNGKIVDKIPIDREDLPQKETTTSNSHACGSNFRNKNGRNAHFWDDYDYQGGRVSGGSEDAVKVYLQGLEINESAISGNKVHIMNEVKPYLTADKENNIYFHQGRYKMREVLMQGVKHFSAWGKSTSPSEHGARPYFFIDGIMLNGRDAYEKGLKIVANHTGDERALARELAPLSIYPVHTYYKTGERKLDFQDFLKPSSDYVSETLSSELKVIKGRVYFNGRFNPVFSKRTYLIKNGDLLGIAENKWAKTPTEEFGTELNPKGPTKEEKDERKVIVLPQSNGDHDDCPCYECRHQDSPKCNNCSELDNYLQAWEDNKKLTEAAEAAKKDIDGNQLTLNTEADKAYKNAYEQDAYNEILSEALNNTVDTCTETLRELITDLYSLGASSKTSELENILLTSKNSLDSFKDKHLK